MLDMEKPFNLFIDRTLKVFNLNSKELADMIGVTTDTIEKWKDGSLAPRGMIKAAIMSSFLGLAASLIVSKKDDIINRG